MTKRHDFRALLAYLARVPAMEQSIGKGVMENDCWWVKFSIKIDHPLAWNVVQEFGHVLNYLSLDERLPTVFMPVSPPSYMNGGPADYLSWVIESTDPAFTPGKAAKWLEGRLPRPVEDISAWPRDE